MLCVLLLYLKVVLKTCNFYLEKLPRTRRGSNPRPRDSERSFQRPVRKQQNSHGAAARALRHARSPHRVRRGQDRLARDHSESDPTRTIPACRGFAAGKKDSHGTTARAIRHAQFPQRVHRDQDRFAQDHGETDPTRAIPAEGSPRARQIRTRPQRERSDTRNLRRGCAKINTDSHGTTARAIRHAQSPQRVHRDQDRFARDHSESDPTRTISAEGAPRPRQIRTGPQRERSDTHNLRRGFAASKTDSHGTTARAIRHARSPQRVRQGQDRFARDQSESDPTRTISAEGSPRSRQIRTGPQRERSDAHDP